MLLAGGAGDLATRLRLVLPARLGQQEADFVGAVLEAHAAD